MRLSTIIYDDDHNNKSSADLTGMADLDLHGSSIIPEEPNEDVCDGEQEAASGGFFDFWKKIGRDEKELEFESTKDIEDEAEEVVNPVAQFLQDRANTFWNNIDILAEEVGLKEPEEEMPDYSHTSVSTTLSDF